MTNPRAQKPRAATASTRRRARRVDRQPQVNDQVDIWWDVDKTYYRGRLSKQLEHSMHFRIVYDDGDTEDINLHNEFWKFVHPPRYAEAPEFDQLSLDDQSPLDEQPPPPPPTDPRHKRHPPPLKPAAQTPVSTAPTTAPTHPPATVNTAQPLQKGTARPESPHLSDPPQLIDPAPLTELSVDHASASAAAPAKSQPPSEKPLQTQKRRLSAAFQPTPPQQQPPQHPSPSHASPGRRPATMTPNPTASAHPDIIVQPTTANLPRTRTSSSSHSASTPTTQRTPHKSATIASQKTKKRRVLPLRADDTTQVSTQSPPPVLPPTTATTATTTTSAAAPVVAAAAAAQLRKIKREESLREHNPEPATEPHLTSKSSSLPAKVTLKRSAPQPSTLSTTTPSPMNHQEGKRPHLSALVREPRLHPHKSIDKKRSELAHRDVAPRGSAPSCASPPTGTELQDAKVVSPQRAENGPVGTEMHTGAFPTGPRVRSTRLQQNLDDHGKDCRMSEDHNLDLVSPVSGNADRDAGIDDLLGRKLAPIERHMSKLADEVHVIRDGFDSTRHLVETTHGQKESVEMKEIKSTLNALDQKVALLCEQVGSVQEQLNTRSLDNQSIKRELLGLVSFLRQEARLRSQREHVIAGNAARVPDSREPPRVQPTANGSVNAARQVSAAPPRAPVVSSYPTVQQYATTSFPPPRNVVQYQQRVAPTTEVAREIRQPHNVVQAQRPEANANPQQATYAVNYNDGRNAQERFTYQVLDLVARQITVWLLETPHEHHKSGMALDLWAKHTSSTAYARIAPRLAMFRSYIHASSTLSISLNNNASELTWFIRPYEAGCTNRARRNYNAWDPPPTDEEWKSETVLLKELANGFHRAFQNYGPLESTVLATSVALTRRTARDYEEAGYRPLLPGP